VHLHAGFHISLHPVRQTSLVQIIRSAQRTGGGAVEVKIASNKKRLTRNTFVSRPSSFCRALCLDRLAQRPRTVCTSRVYALTLCDAGARQVVAADSLECLLGQSKCSNVVIIPNKDRPSGPLSEQERRIGFVHEHGTVSFSTNLSSFPSPPKTHHRPLLADGHASRVKLLMRCSACAHCASTCADSGGGRGEDRTGVMMLAILTGFRDVNQALQLPPPPVSPLHCPTWVERKSGWDAVARCIQWSACDDASADEARDGQDVSRNCARLRCLCTSVPPLVLFHLLRLQSCPLTPTDLHDFPLRPVTRIAASRGGWPAQSGACDEARGLAHATSSCLALQNAVHQ